MYIYIYMFSKHGGFLKLGSPSDHASGTRAVTTRQKHRTVALVSLGQIFLETWAKKPNREPVKCDGRGVYILVYLYIYTYVCMYIYICIVCIYIYMCVYTCIYIYVCMYVRTYVCR